MWWTSEASDDSLQDLQQNVIDIAIDLISGNVGADSQCKRRIFLIQPSTKDLK